MSNDKYTPTTDRVCEVYVRNAWRDEPENCFRAPGEAEFYRWLTEVRAEARRDAIREATEHLDNSPAVTWTGKGGVRERLHDFMNKPSLDD